MPGFDCIIRGCNSYSSKSKDVEVFPVPCLNNSNEAYRDLSTRRRLGWIIVINRKDITWETSGQPGIGVCSRHFHSGRPAPLMEETNPDWIPSLNLQSNRTSDEMMKYRWSQIAPQRDNKTKIGRRRRCWTAKKRLESRKKSYLSGGTSILNACQVESSTDSATNSDASLGSSDEEVCADEAQKHFEIPVLNDIIRALLIPVLHAYKDYGIDNETCKSEPLAVVTTTFTKDNLITWNCKDMRTGESWFAATTALEKMKMSKDMLKETFDGYSLYARAECERDFVQLLKVMKTHNCPFLEITCNSVKAVLHLDKFHCPGVTRRCVEYNGTLVTPVELMKAVCPFNPKDWKYHFKVHKNGAIIGFLFASDKLDFTDHDQFCTHLCGPDKEALLIEYAEENSQTPDKEYLRDKCCLPSCRNCIPNDTGVTYVPLPSEKERCEIWLQNMGVLPNVVGQDFARIKEANLKLCSDHFDDDQFILLSGGRKRQLRWQAVPTVFEKRIPYVPAHGNPIMLHRANVSDNPPQISQEDDLSTSVKNHLPNFWAIMEDNMPSLKESSSHQEEPSIIKKEHTETEKDEELCLNLLKSIYSNESVTHGNSATSGDNSKRT